MRRILWQDWLFLKWSFKDATEGNEIHFKQIWSSICVPAPLVESFMCAKFNFHLASIFRGHVGHVCGNKYKKIKNLLKIKFNKLCNLFSRCLAQEAAWACFTAFLITTLFNRFNPNNELLQGRKKFEKCMLVKVKNVIVAEIVREENKNKKWVVVTHIVEEEKKKLKSEKYLKLKGVTHVVRDWCWKIMLHSKKKKSISEQKSKLLGMIKIENQNASV